MDTAFNYSVIPYEYVYDNYYKSGPKDISWILLFLSRKIK